MSSTYLMIIGLEKMDIFSNTLTCEFNQNESCGKGLAIYRQ